MKNEILCCVFNHNENDKAIRWWERLNPYFDTVILDSGSDPACSHPSAINLPNVYYSGLMNKAYELLVERDYQWLVVLTDDIQIEDKYVPLLCQTLRQLSLSENVALYQPSCRWSLKGRALPQSLCHFTGKIRNTNFQEGWFHFVRRDVLAAIMPVDTQINKMGWGIDILLSHIARINNLLVLVDDRIQVLHPKGTGYNKDIALAQMRQWLDSFPGYVSPRHFRPSKDKISYSQTL